MPGGTRGCADGTQQDRVAAGQAGDLIVGQDVAGAKEALAPQVESRRGSYSRSSRLATSQEYLEGLGHHFRADAVAGEHSDLDQNTLHGNRIGTGEASRLFNRH